MPTYLMPQCPNCKHCRDIKEGQLKPGCDAFPDGIPDEIWYYQLKDHLPYKRRYKDRKAGEERGPAIYRTYRTEEDLAYLEKDLCRVCQAIRFNIFFRAPSQVGSCNGFCRFKDVCLGEMETPTLSQSQLEAIKEVA